MNFRDKREIPPKYIYLFLAIICFIMLFLSVLFENRFSPLKALTSTIITPMQTGVNKVGTSLFDGVVNKKEKKALIEENEQLKEKMESYAAQIKEYEQESYELKRLQDLLALKEQYVQYNTIGARVIATDSTNWFSTFVIDKGEKDGIKVGCNVLAGNGLAGIVTEVGKNYSKIRAIIDDSSNVSATISGTETLCTVSGDLSHIKDGYINVGYINKADTIEEGAELVTSHVSDKFLPGLLIGYISEVTMDANNLTKSAKCIPVVDFHNLREVLVVLDMKADLKTNSNSENIYNNITNTEDMIENGDTTESSTTSEESTQVSSEDTTEASSEDTSEDASENAPSETPQDTPEDNAEGTPSEAAGGSQEETAPPTQPNGE
ncbi:MAG: rod shape-determining protein MreC [Lachnospiraceae bacterium]|nr:rod shape-determining protein MreC [Lachnospiraceae bacterium]